jgi:hypothetical protein
MADRGENYPWYRSVSGPVLEQGDILFNCPIFVISIGVLPLASRTPWPRRLTPSRPRRKPAVELPHSMSNFRI